LKKILSFVMLLMTLAIALGINIGAVSAAPIGVTVKSPVFKNRPVDTKLDGYIYDRDTNKTIHFTCTVRDDQGTVSCQVPEKFAGEGISIFISLDAQSWHGFSVTVPKEHEKDKTAVPPPAKPLPLP